jgi:ribonucleoside-diphosphate reductase alpha chain
VEKAAIAGTSPAPEAPRAPIAEFPARPKPAETVELANHLPGEFKVIRRNGKVTAFDPTKISVAITKAFLEVEGGTAAASTRIHHEVDQLTDMVVRAVTRRMPGGGTVHIEDIQDHVELALMRTGEQKVARAYVIYREERARLRAEKARQKQSEDGGLSRPTVIGVTLKDGGRRPLDMQRLMAVVNEACAGLEFVQGHEIIDDALRNLFDGVKESDVNPALVMSARALVEKEPNYSRAAARLLLDALRREALSFIEGADSPATHSEMSERYPLYFRKYIQRAAALELLDDELTRYDLDRLGRALKPERDRQFTYLGLQTLYDRYFIHTDNGIRFELPQAFFMRVAMGLAMKELDREARAIEFYELLSSFDFMSSTPTLFNSGTLRPQLSSCYLTTVPDDLDGIFSAIRDDALLSKFAGGLGNDWTRVRAMGAHIKGTNGRSQGVVPFLKVANDTAVAVNQCFAPDTTVFTADGVKPIKDIRTGDLVLGQRGRYREVTSQMAYNQIGPMVEIRVKHSLRPMKVTTGHPLWAIRNVPLEQAQERTLSWLERGKVRPQWVDAGELRRGDFVAQVIPGETVPVPGLDADDARLYGVLLGDGHLSKDGMQWGVSGNPGRDAHLQFVRDYLTARGIHFWETGRGATYCQIHWASGHGVVRDGTTGRIAGAGAPTLSFSYGDLYDTSGNKRMARRFMHLPLEQTLHLVRGLLETDGGVSRGKEIYFTSTSQPLAEGLRYQLLRLGVPCAGQYRERRQDHVGHRSDGSHARFHGTVKAWDLRIPAVPEIAALVGCRPAKTRNWLIWNNWLFTRVRSVRDMAPVPFVYDLKVEGDESYMTSAALAHNGGKRKGAMCAYLETWHLDIEEFLDLRKNTGDDRRRTHDMNTANWVPDLFMKRVSEDGAWTLFSPDETGDLHDLVGAAFERRYGEYEAAAARGQIRNFKQVRAVDLWRRMLSMLYETGHPWITFKDPCNLRSPQQHAGVVHSSNLCTEITLNTSDDEIAVCNLGSVNLAQHVDDNGLQIEKLEKTVRTAMRMLDNVIDYNYYSVPQARRSNLKHRPVGLGIMGFQDALHRLRIPYASEPAIDFADASMEAVSFYAIKASTELAEERGAYSSFNGSLWSKGILPIDSVGILERERGGYLEVDRTARMDWDALRKRVKKFGMRNSNCMAIAPTATISNICGVCQSIEPTYQNLFVKSNLSGEFTVVNPYLVRDLKARNLWDEVMVNDLKYFDGSVQPIDRIPGDLKWLYATAFEIDPRWLVEAGSRRQKWIDQAQSLNLYMAEPNGKKLDNLYKLAWVRGLKTTYYLRSLGATHVEKSTLSGGRESRLAAVERGSAEPAEITFCSVDNPECDVCQ